MPTLSRERVHNMSLDKAKETVEGIVEDVRQTYPMLVSNVDWNRDRTSAKVTGKMFKGDFTVDAKKVTIILNLSLLAKPFMGKVEKRIDDKLAEYFG